jgi:predicted Zn-dependent protease
MDSIEELFREVKRLRILHQDAQSIATLEFITKSSDASLAQVDRAHALLSQYAKGRKAYVHAKLLVERHPDDAFAWALLARAARKCGFRRVARVADEERIRLAPKLIEKFRKASEARRTTIPKARPRR